MAEDEDNPFARIKTFPCDICGRKFKQESLAKHKSICKKQKTKPRKIFDSGRQRAQGSDVNYQVTKETRKVQIEGKPAEGPSQSNWREKHNNFIKSVRQARITTEAIKTGGPVPKFEPSAVPSDYVNCQYCGRNFSKNAAERHIPFCENQSKRQKVNQPKAAPVKFQAPMPRKKSSEVNSNNYGDMNYGAGSGGNPNSRQAPAANTRGYGNHSGNSVDRRPIKYDSQYYYESDSSQEQGGYSMKNKQMLANKNAAAAAAAAKRQEQILRTGRNMTNSELNAMARNRSGNSLKDLSGNSRDPSQNRRQVQTNGGMARQPVRTTAAGGQNYESNNVSKFCHECGSEFPVQWARFCSFCGDKRV